MLSRGRKPDRQPTVHLTRNRILTMQNNLKMIRERIAEMEHTLNSWWHDIQRLETGPRKRDIVDERTDV